MLEGVLRGFPEVPLVTCAPVGPSIRLVIPPENWDQATLTPTDGCNSRKLFSGWSLGVHMPVPR